MKQESNKSWKSSAKRTALEWLGILAVFAILYATGLHTQVLGTLQRGMLWTGLFDAQQTEVNTSSGPYLSAADYDFKMTDPEGNIVQLAQFKGDVLFINNWASWCAPCVAEMPTIESLYESTRNKDNIHFLLISQDESMQKAAQFMEDRDFNMPYYVPVSPLPQKFRTAYIPSTFVVSSEGQIIFKKEGIADYSSESFKNWMNELAEE